MDLQVKDSDIFEAIFGNSHHNSFFQLKVLLEISQPMMFTLEHKDKTFLIYVLRDMTKMNGERFIKIQELLFSEVTKEVIAELSESGLSIYDAFLNSSQIWRVGKIGDKVFPRKAVMSVADIQDRFPLQGVRLKDVPNIAV